MADVERAPEPPDPAGAAARSMAQLAQQMREMADRMLSGGLPGRPVAAPGPPDPGPADTGQPRGAGPGGGGRTPAIPGLPATPVGMSARQVQAVVDDVAARRAQVRALVVQLEAFDEQLGALESSLRPLLQWLRTWADLEGAVTDFWTPRPPQPPQPPRS